MKIRPASLSDLPRIQEIFSIGRAYMRSTGNMTQWSDGYPHDALLRDDIKKEQLFVLENESGLHGVFAFILGDDPTYGYIEGEWPNSLPYGTIHRIASDGTVRGIVGMAKAFALRFTDQVRADTHHDNLTMQHVLEKHGFVRCGVIYLENGDPRVAYQYAHQNH